MSKTMRTDTDPGQNGVTKTESLKIDALIVGAGFSGCYLLHKLRSSGLNAKIVEAGTGYGGVWHWNCYPGARVDSPVPIYEYDIPEIWKTWSWPEMFPSGKQIQLYFDHVDDKLNLRKDTIWSTKIVAAEFDSESNQWTATAHNGHKFVAQYFILATGFAAKRSFPDWPGLDKFAGEIHHSSFWPFDGIDINGKKVAVVGTGSTGLQIAQTIVDSAKDLTIFQRTPNLALPLLQKELVKEEEEKRKETYPIQFEQRLTTFAGYPYDKISKNTFDDSAEQRHAFFEELYEKGGFHLWLANYSDILSNKQANDEVYKCWASNVRGLIQDPKLADILAPLTPPHPFGTKRSALQWRWFEMFNEPHVHIVDIKSNPVERVDETGIVTQDGKHHDVDIIALATGFDAISGGINAINIRGTDKGLLRERWEKEGVRTALGMMIEDYPNMFMLYGPQGPTAFANGPSCIEVQANWLTNFISDLRRQGIRRIEPKVSATDSWCSRIEDDVTKSLFAQADSWYMGANIPGKRRQMLNFIGGIPAYIKALAGAKENGYNDFSLSP